MMKKSIVIAVLLVLSGLSTACADVFMKQSVKTDSFKIMGRTQPAQEQTVEIWMTKDRMKTRAPQQTMLFRLDEKKMYLINDARKTWAVSPINMGELADQVAEQDEEMTEEDKQAFAQMFKGMTQMSITVQETSDTRTINGWHCRKYIQTLNSMMGPITSEVWATEDIEVDTALLAQTNAAMLSMQPGAQENAAATIRELEKIKGVPVLTVTSTSMMGATFKSSTELVECKNQDSPSGTFELPKGYTEVPFMTGPGVS